MKSRFGTLAMRGVGALAAAALLAMSTAGPAGAQQADTDYRTDVIIDAAGAQGVADHNASAARRNMGFQLFASRDAAGAGSHLPGNMSRNMDNYSPCDAPLNGFCRWSNHPSRNPAVATFQFFEVLWFAGAPPSEWVKIRNVAPSVANAKGGGYVTIMNFALFRPQHEWGPRDGTLSTLFSGVTSTNDGSCRDHTGFNNGSFPTGLPLLASSNCPDTWPGTGWGGDRTAPLESYLQLWQAAGQAFEFDPLDMPDALKRPGPFAGTNFSYYGETSDHYQEQLEAYGSVIPGGSGDPTIEGYPLGLVIHWDNFSFGVPSLASVEFTRATFINRSEDVYGTGIDYDSLYIGLAPGTGGSGAGGMQRMSNYYLPGISAGIYHQSNLQGAGGPCDDGSRIPSGAVGCASSASPGIGYGNGGNAIIILRSPIGDQRNKLFTRTPSGSPCIAGVDPFCDPTHPLADDTITFNHGHICGFGGCWASTHNVNDKRSFGMISSQPAVVMDGRDPGTLSGSEAFRTFRNFDYPTVIGDFNYWVPGLAPGFGSWDWNNDGVQDTLRYDTCHTAGCVVLDADTLPGGHVNAYGNVGGVLTAGPISLAAGDSTTWWMAFVGEQDSASTWAAIDAALDLYMNFFLAPEAPPPATIASSQIQAATDGTGNVGENVTIFFTEDPENWVDPFLSKLADDLEAAPAGTPNGDLVAANPTLVADLRARAADNLERIEIYKSCNGGGTFTSDSDCIGDPATDETGAPVGFGWEAYAILDVDANAGDIPNAFSDNAVQGGRTYLYVLVAKSRGAEFLVIDPLSGTPMTVEFAPTIRNTLSRSSSDPNVISIYVPASNQSGFVSAEATFNVEGGTSTVPFEIDFSDNVVPGNYVVRFGNQFIVERDSNTTNDMVEGTRVIVERTVLANGGVVTVVDSVEYFHAGADVLPVAGTPSATATTTVGNIVRTSDTYVGIGFAVAGGSTPFFVSLTLSGEAATPTSVFALSDFPGFTVSADNSPAGTYNTAAELALRGDLTKARLGTTQDTVTRGTVDAAMTQWREQNSSRTSDGGGHYAVSWQDEAFGLPNGMTLNFLNPAASGAELRAALAARTATTTGATDAATAALIGVAQSDLVPVRIPFSVRNETFDRDITIAMERRLSDTYLLGAGSDTIRVEIQPDEWVPGDVLVFIETITEDSVDGAGDVVLDGAGRPVQAQRVAVAFSEAVIGCNAPRPPACNPTAANTRGQSGYLPRAMGDTDEFEYYVGFDANTLFDFDLVAPVRGTDITSVTDSALQEIRVVPNPFVVLSQYQTSLANSRVLFTNVPPMGELRIYTVSGQFVQQIDWTPDDLSGAGDLFYDLKTRENIDIASGLYIWVLTAPSDPTNASSAPVTARGKFVVIRGKPR